ncbi:alpha-D-ribose 1-methylphosphonate 5-triphosphate diphosphatase, partial [Enterobacter bugandensis]|nr:alpha-D-ribose 1-methylphosphonate 5-triphosphate diphosphatase [Enterobacter bugandensis]
ADRGVIAEGKRADLILARTHEDSHNQHVYVQNVWRQGIQVF